MNYKRDKELIKHAIQLGQTAAQFAQLLKARESLQGANT